MSPDKDFNFLLEKIYSKLEAFHSVEESDVMEIKNKLREISGMIYSSDADENIEKISSQLTQVEESNSNLKESISDLITTSNELMQKLNTTDETSIIKLQSFLTELSYQVASIKENIEESKDDSQKHLLDGFTDIQKGLKTFEENLEEKIKNDFEGLSHSLAEIVEDLTEKLNLVEVQFEKHNNTLSNEVAVTLKQIQTHNENTNKHLENITNLQNLALTNAEYEEFKKEAEQVQTEQFNNLKEEINELHEKLSSEIIELLNKASSEQDLDQLKTVLDESLESTTDEISQIKDFIQEIGNSSIEKTAGYLEEIKELLLKQDNVELASSIQKINEIYSNINTLNNWLKNIEKINKNVLLLNKKFDEDKENSIDFNELADKVDIVYENISVLNEWASKLDTINKEIDALNEKVEETNQITEDEEDTANKIDIIYENLSLLNNWVVKIDSLAEMSNKVDDVSESVSNISTWGYKIEDIKGKLEELSNEFAIITSATKDDTENYIYTLLDIESDFAKLHCLLDSNTKTTEDDLQVIKEQFEVIGDDISSISKRTNKLILTSDDANKIFRSHVDKFQSLIEDLRHKITDFYPEKQFTLLDNKVNTIKKITASNFTISQNLNEAFLLFAQWIDSTEETFANFKQSLEGIQLQNAEILNEASKPEMNQIKYSLTELSEKFEAFSQDNLQKAEIIAQQVLSKCSQQLGTISSLEEKISSLESKIDALESKMEKGEDGSEVKTILDFIASQVISANENSINNKVLNQKMEIMEHQLSKFEKNIAKLVSYLDED